MPNRKISLVLTAVTALAVASTAVAGSGGGKSTSNISLVVLSSARTADSGPRYGDEVTFAVSTTATDRPYVLLNCYQGDVRVSGGQAGFWASYPSKTFVLTSPSWTSGAAECTARLGSLNADGTRFRELASTSFSVSA
jgi:hypothetical protein